MAKSEKAPKTPPPDPGRPQEGPPAPAPPPKKGNLKLILLIVVAMAVGGAGAFLAMKVIGGKKAPPADSAEAAQGEGGDEGAPAAAGHGSSDEEPIVAPSKSGRGGAPAGGHGAPAEGGEGAPAYEGPVIVKLDPFTTNLNPSGGRAFIKLTLSFEVDGQAQADQVNGRMDDIRDAVIMYLMGVSVDDISDPGGVARLKERILSRVNAIFPDRPVRKINITDIAIQ
jgi:flagellar FliL protein